MSNTMSAVSMIAASAKPFLIAISTFFCTIFTAYSGREIVLPAAVLRLVVNYIVVYDFRGSAADVIHPSNPPHLIIRFELFGHALTFYHLLLFYHLPPGLGLPPDPVLP